ncbi:MAG: hypothetical protein QOJ23_5618, partial [Actinomycetota bacterium]|nr:hypothetical protein [Actinomycetota bacterium]
PPGVEEQLVLAESGDAPALYDHLRVGAYDAVFFVGLHSPVTYFGMRALAEGRRAFLVPGGHDAADVLSLHMATLARAERILVCTEGERQRILRAAGPGSSDRVDNVGFLTGVNTIVGPDAGGAGPGGFVVIARDWRSADSRGRHAPWAAALARALPSGVELRLVGPGAAGLPAGVPHTEARIDAWWWMSRAIAVLDPEPHRVVGQETLEALLYGVPVVVADNGDASREHAEAGDGGLWFRVRDELVASIERLLDDEVHRSLGEQGRSYAARFADADTWVKRLAEVLLG